MQSPRKLFLHIHLYVIIIFSFFARFHMLVSYEVEYEVRSRSATHLQKQMLTLTVNSIATAVTTSGGRLFAWTPPSNPCLPSAWQIHVPWIRRQDGKGHCPGHFIITLQPQTWLRRLQRATDWQAKELPASFLFPPVVYRVVLSCVTPAL